MLAALKAPILDRQIRGVRFVGAHPLAGSHKTGVKAARPDLFKGATCVLVPQDRSALKAVRDDVENGRCARVITMSARARMTRRSL